MAVDVQNFQEDVLEKSHSMPVLVDFWAPWCGPCRVLGPVLEKLEAESNAAWLLAKVNTDEHPTLSQEYGIRGIPAVKLFVDGKVVNTFTGAMPEFAVRQWLDAAMPNTNKTRLAQAEAALATNSPDIAEPLLREVLADEPDNAKAKTLLALILTRRSPRDAVTLVNGTPREPDVAQVQDAIQTVAHLTHQLDNPDELPDEPGRISYLEGLSALMKRDFETAIAKMIEVLQVNRYYADDGARKAGVAIFTMLGEQHPVTLKYRRTFDMWLY